MKQRITCACSIGTDVWRTPTCAYGSAHKKWSRQQLTAVQPALARKYWSSVNEPSALHLSPTLSATVTLVSNCIGCGHTMSHTSRIPRGCFAVPNWNGDILICDPRSKLEDSCRVLVYRRDDLRVRIVGTYAPRSGQAQKRTVRVLVDGPGGEAQFQEFDSDYINVTRIVNIQRTEPRRAAAPTKTRSGVR